VKLTLGLSFIPRAEALYHPDPLSSLKGLLEELTAQAHTANTAVWHPINQAFLCNFFCSYQASPAELNY